MPYLIKSRIFRKKQRLCRIMEKVKNSSGTAASGDNNQQQQQQQPTAQQQPAAAANNNRQSEINAAIQILVHSCFCNDENCKIQRCLPMKRVIAHVKSCQVRTNGGCPTCKQLVALCCQHAKNCKTAVCSVPFCTNIKLKMKQQHQNFQQQQQQQQQPAAQQLLPNRNQENGVPKKPVAQSRPQQFDAPTNHAPDISEQQNLAAITSPPTRNQQQQQQQQQPTTPKNKTQQLGVCATMQEISNSCRCKNSNCQMQGYKSMKQVVAHINTCQKGVRGGCPTCNYHVALCCHHSKLCQKDDCPLAFCKNLKLKLKHHQQFKNVFHESLLRVVENSTPMESGIMIPSSIHFANLENLPTQPSDYTGIDSEEELMRKRQLAIDATMQEIVNACSCQDLENCQMQSYQSMKGVVAHSIKNCHKRSHGGCVTCKKLILLCCHHSSLCQKTQCPLLFCNNLKIKLKQQQEFQTNFQDTLLRIVESASLMRSESVTPDGGQALTNSASSNLTTTINSQIVPAFDKLHIEQQKEAFLGDKDEKVAIIEQQVIKKTPTAALPAATFPINMLPINSVQQNGNAITATANCQNIENGAC